MEGDKIPVQEGHMILPRTLEETVVAVSRTLVQNLFENELLCPSQSASALTSTFLD